jgi:hydrogenase/urease accessory protein HupE
VGVHDLRPALILAVLLAALPALGHELGMLQVEATFQKDGTYVIEVLVDPEHYSMDDVENATVLLFDGRRVDPGRAERTGDKLRFRGRTPPAVSRFTFANDAAEGMFVLKLRNEGQPPVTQWIAAGNPSAPFALDRSVIPKTRWEIVKLYVVLGFTHILPRGLDHVLFVLGIFLLAVRLKPVLWQVTAFTVAHTITLALSIYGVVTLPASIVEPLIALSIAYVAIENIFTERLHAWRPLVVFGFGLLHGMGFAGVLTEIGLPRSEFVPALLAFNIGVELGQLTVILVALPLVGAFRNRSWYRRRIVIPCSLAIAVVGLFWFIDRVR